MIERPLLAVEAGIGTDLVAGGRHDRSGMAERLLGSVTDRVRRTLDRPVLVVPA